jgi:hypothetical protein
MDWNPREAQAAARFESLDLSLSGALTHSPSGPTSTWGLCSDGRPYRLPGGNRFPSLEAMEAAYASLMPSFRYHAMCCHALMLTYYDEPQLQDPIDHWISSGALPAHRPANAGFPWTCAVQVIRRDGSGHLQTFGAPWTLPADATAPAWTDDDTACARYDPARPHVYLDAVSALIRAGEPLWLATRMPKATTPSRIRRL